MNQRAEEGTRGEGREGREGFMVGRCVDGCIRRSVSHKHTG